MAQHILRHILWHSIPCGTYFGIHCGTCYGTASKAKTAVVDISLQVCSSCRGQIQALGRFNQDGTPAKVRAPSRYSLFVKENFASHKKKCAPGTPHKEIMQALSCSWKARAGASDLAEVAESAAVL